MDASRRAQMSAHLRQVQESLMEEHAEKIAHEFAANLSVEEKDKMREQFNRIDAKGIDLEYKLPKSPVDMEESLKMFSEAFGSLMGAEDKASKPPASSSPRRNDSETDANARQADLKDDGADGAPEEGASYSTSAGHVIRTRGANARVHEARRAAAAIHEAKKGFNKSTRRR